MEGVVGTGWGGRVYSFVRVVRERCFLEGSGRVF